MQKVHNTRGCLIWCILSLYSMKVQRMKEVEELVYGTPSLIATHVTLLSFSYSYIRLNTLHLILFKILFYSLLIFRRVLGVLEKWVQWGWGSHARVVSSDGGVVRREKRWVLGVMDGGGERGGIPWVWRKERERKKINFFFFFNIGNEQCHTTSSVALFIVKIFIFG